MARILITGGTGFVGHWMNARKLRGVEVYRMGRSLYNKFNWVNQNWAGIIHLAPTSPAAVLECASRNHARVLYASSGIVYYPDDNKQYRLDKLRYERECLTSGMDVVIARMFTFCGEKLDDNKAITSFEKAARSGTPLIITGDGSTVRSYMHGSEMADWMWAIYQRGARGEIYDVGSDEPVTMRELADRIVMENKSKSEIITLNGTDPRPYYMPFDTAKTKKLLQGGI